jgi:hypothetical protein
LISLLDLHGEPQIKEAIPDAPLQSHIWLTTIASSSEGPHRVSIHAAPGGDGILALDGNQLEFNDLGEAVWTTSALFPTHKVSLRKWLAVCVATGLGRWKARRSV